MERAERTVAIVIGLLAANAHIALIELAVFSSLASIQRIYYTRAALGGRTPPSGSLLYWTFGRGTAEHTMMSVALILFLMFGHRVIPAP